MYSDAYFGYGVHEDAARFLEEYARFRTQVQELKKDGLCAAVYTQLSDIEEEINGLVTYDRRVEKV